ncbi:MAG: hypothetical protein ACRDNP_08070 [Gaiellaceae bacterium]
MASTATRPARNRGEIGLPRRTRRVEAARSENDELRRALAHRLPGGRKRRLTGPPQDLLAARELDHLRYPVPGGERRVEPLGHERPERREADDELADAVDLRSHLRHDRRAAIRNR